eukprot:CAMPEP_0170453292 /NCGR_PEP_ID=MMETSP0123-20130129/1918_1 /TAXON_ID=182087 /ORGANISM="Favella ehrenbergii, Strain Fehren 1" /LENGTH=67 /DNA_ID=CAMNT_0010715607 /DNA_START=512 /DNA_END=715 /DNA_ORIENTATION=-
MRLQDLIDNESFDDNFFFKYKNLSLAQNNLYKAMKSTEQMRDDKAVHVFFSKLITLMTRKELSNMNK